ncbi:hypothetical protein [Saccharopolyspora sp. 5N708]|uniref:hypothetical protein n=1 Tax=Saccharopolyspora sp. 5N708 TaxID=3457424 RepID=UPI003FD1C57B
MANAAHRSSPDVEGIDRTGVVRVRLDSDGIPIAIRVRPRWRDSLPSERLAAAVGEAADAAAEQRTTSWAAMLAEGRREEHDDERCSSKPPELPFPERASRKPRDLDALAEQMLAALSAAQELAQHPPPVAQGVGAAAGGKLTLTVSSVGQLSCVVDREWIGTRGGARLTHALSEALAQARSKLRKAVATQLRSARKWDSAVDEALSIMRELDKNHPL